MWSLKQFFFGTSCQKVNLVVEVRQTRVRWAEENSQCTTASGKHLIGCLPLGSQPFLLLVSAHHIWLNGLRVC